LVIRMVRERVGGTGSGHSWGGGDEKCLGTSAFVGY
jgi:hypothetical protein